MLSAPIRPPANYLANLLFSDLSALANSLMLVFDDFHFIESKSVQISITVKKLR
jgi:ATP/maltotriose-dependent transcriptional regulator MalT